MPRKVLHPLCQMETNPYPTNARNLLEHLIMLNEFDQQETFVVIRDCTMSHDTVTGKLMRKLVLQ